MEKDEHSELEAAAKSARLNKLTNKVTAFIKIAGGIFARNAVNVSEGFHDLGDANIHGDHEKELNALSAEEARYFAIRGAVKLGAFSLAGAGVEMAIENSVEYSPNHLLGFFIALGSVALNAFLRHDAAGHTHTRAHSLRSHTHWDLLVSGVTFLNATALLSGVNVSPAYGVAAHVALGIAPAVAIVRHQGIENEIEEQLED